MEELLKVKILKKYFRLKSEDNNREKFTLNPINMIEMELDNYECIYE